MDIFFWWSGVALWAVTGPIGAVCLLLLLHDWVWDVIVERMWVRKEFFVFAADRMKARERKKGIPG